MDERSPFEGALSNICLYLLSYFALGGAEVLYLFKQTSFADHAPNEDILKALGIAPKPSS